MKKRITYLLLWALCCLSNSAFALDKVDGVYQIGTADELIEFANIVNGGENDANAVLTADIDMDGKDFVPIGCLESRYIGTFDGQYHVIDNIMYIGSSRIGIFGVVNGGCYIKNLIAGPGNTFMGDQFIGGIVGASDGSGWVTLENVGHEGYVEGQGNNCCAIFGVVMDGGPATRIINCYNTGDVKAGGESAIITGWFGGHGYVEVLGFWNTGHMLSGGQNDGKDLWRNSASITTERIFNLYDAQGATIIEDGDVASGKLAFQLNGNKDAGVWRQNLEGANKDAQPTFDPSHALVYANGSLQCDGITPKPGTDVAFSNHEGSSVDEHVFAGGFCTGCGKWQENFLEADADGFYPIADGAQLNWFAYMINQGKGDANAKLTANIDMDGLAFTPIGQDGRDFKGHFDGQGHRILNLTTNAELNNQALFGQAVGGAIIENVIIDASCTMAGNACAAGILGHVWGDGVIVRNCGNEADINGTAQNAAGIIACSEKEVHIENCYNLGTITGSHENAGICAWMGSNKSTIKNCYSTGLVNDGAGLYRHNSVQGENLYQMDGDQGIAFTETQLKSGELAYLLNGKQSDNVSWYQVIGTEDHPVPFGTAVVYANGNLECDGITPVAGGTISYSNTPGGNVAAHTWNDWGFCDKCGGLNANYLTPVDGFYQLATDKHVNWFAYYVTKENQSANAQLTADIDMGEVFDYPGIGDNNHPYAGIFEGQGHLIKNLTIDMPEDANVGFFRDITAGAQISGFTIDNSCSIRGKNFVGAFIGRASGSGEAFLSQLGNEGNVTSIDQNAGALVGCNTSNSLHLNIENCYNTGDITSGWEAGGLSGWLGNDAVVTNCYNMGAVTNGESFARGNNIQITNCFDPVTDWPALPVSPIEDFTNGIVYQALSEAAPGIWFEAEDGHPVLYHAGGSTGISTAKSQQPIANSQYFDLQGRKVSAASMHKGIYVKNGRKFVIK